MAEERDRDRPEQKQAGSAVILSLSTNSAEDPSTLHLLCLSSANLNAGSMVQMEAGIGPTGKAQDIDHGKPRPLRQLGNTTAISL